MTDPRGTFYEGQFGVPESEEEQFAMECPCRKLQDDTAFKLEAEVRWEELLLALTQLHTGSTLGPNGLPAQIFKRTAGEIARLLHKMYLAGYKVGELLRDLCTASIVLITKAGKALGAVGLI
ncbi:hypothetical protein NDU88_001802 [Pleurodeles waltl]|uniref:Uncharacterized protein n=1 Tax=Pleurodeles waltl TaxID=8319 RepID=A0AAV7MVN0_PLEWA|nr:hypothetical protein NDU88_001802 [Pleurodeles waltl]